MSDTERLDRAACISNGILIGTVIRVADNTESPDAPRYALIQPVRWLKGASGSGPIVITFPEASRDQFYLLRADTAYVFFMYRAPSNWYLNPDTNIPDFGLIQVSSGRSGPVGDQIAQVLLDQSPDSMAVRADVVLVGTPVLRSQVPSTFVHPSRRHDVFRVDSVIAGEVRDSIIAVIAAFLPDYEYGSRQLLFLRRLEDKTFEVLSSGAGAFSTKDTIPRLRLTIGDAQARIKALRTGAAGGARKP